MAQLQNHSLDTLQIANTSYQHTRASTLNFFYQQMIFVLFVFFTPDGFIVDVLSIGRFSYYALFLFFLFASPFTYLIIFSTKFANGFESHFFPPYSNCAHAYTSIF